MLYRDQSGIFLGPWRLVDYCDFVAIFCVPACFPFTCKEQDVHLSCLRCAACRSCPVLVSVERLWAHQRPLICLSFHSFIQGQEQNFLCVARGLSVGRELYSVPTHRSSKAKDFKWFVLDSLSVWLCHLQCSGTVGRCQQPPITTMRNCFL